MTRMSRLSSPGRPPTKVLVVGLAVLGVLVLVGALVGVLVSTGGDDDETSPAEDLTSTTTTASADPAAYLEVPDGVELTEAGTVLALGETATVAWEPAIGTVAVADVTLTALQPAPIAAFDGWLVGGTGLQAAPYFLQLTIANVGEVDLGGQSLPLYLERQDDRLVPAARFGAEFPACASTPLPQPFDEDASVTTCQVYLSEGGQEVESLAFLPKEGVEPVRWDPTLPVVTPTGTPTATSTATSTGTPSTSGTPTSTGTAGGSATTSGAPTTGATTGATQGATTPAED